MLFFRLACIASELATGATDSPFCDPASSHDNSHANGRNPPQRAARNQSDEPLTFPGVSGCDSANKDNAAQHGAASCRRATQRTRTADLSFTKAPLDFTSVEDTVAYKSPESYPDSRHDSSPGDPPIDSDLSDLIDAWHTIPSSVRAAIVMMARATTGGTKERQP